MSATPARAHARLRIRDMSHDDLGAVLAIERASFTVPWTPATFIGLLDRSDAHLFVAERTAGPVPDEGEPDPEPEIVGYAALWIVLDQAELGDIAVAEPHRNQGIGRLLLDAVFHRAREKGVRDLFLEVRVSNTAARRLYERHGFRPVSRRRNYYNRPREDALVLRKRM